MPNDLQPVREAESGFAAWAFEPFPAAALDSPLVERFDAVADRHADRLAASDAERTLSYGDLAAMVARIGATIAAVADRPGPVAILLANEARYPAAMLGALAAGHPYVPLDAHHPIERNLQ